MVKKKDIVVFSIVQDSECSECGAQLGKGRFLTKEGADRVLCASCADLDHLVYLPRGDAVLTRRASKHSSLRAVVVRFRRARARYERQGVLVEEAALRRAEEECLGDAEARALRRERESDRRARLDEAYVAAFAEHLRAAFPSCPPEEAGAIAEHACVRSSGRVGRTARAKEFDRDAIELAVRAHVRHAHTRYDELLAAGRERIEAREAVSSEVGEVLRRWRKPVGAGRE